MPFDEPSTTTITVTISGPATLYESSEIRDTFQSALEEGKDVRIDLETSGPWDLAGLQLLVSVLATGHKEGHSVRLVNVPGVCREIAERSGLSGWLADATDSFL